MAIYRYLRTSEYELEAEHGAEPSNLEWRLEQEQQALQDYCLAHHWGSTPLIEDHAALRDADFAAREQASLLLAALRPDDVLLAYSLERVFSSCYDACATIERFRELRVALHIVELHGAVTDPTLLVDMVTAAHVFAGLERRRSVERIKNVKRNQRSKGRYLGGNRPFGYMIHSNGRLIENPLEQKVLRRIVNLRAKGKSLRAIAKALSTPVAPISFKTVQRILQRNV